MALATKGAVRLARGFTFEHIDRLVLNGELHVHQADDFHSRAIAFVAVAISPSTVSLTKMAG
jgi:hypothetical protein